MCHNVSVSNDAPNSVILKSTNSNGHLRRDVIVAYANVLCDLSMGSPISSGSNANLVQFKRLFAWRMEHARGDGQVFMRGKLKKHPPAVRT